VAIVLEIARALRALPATPRPIVMLITDGEESGLLGAVLFARGHPLAKRVTAAVNVEARGTSGPSLMFETGSANGWLMRLYGSTVARPVTNSIYYEVYRLLSNDTDFTVFKEAGYQGFNFAFIGNVGRYHTPLDSAANADARSIQHQGDNALSVLLGLANSPATKPPAGEAVFFDGFGRTLFSWPARLTLPAALVVLACLLVETLLLLRRGWVSGREIVWGCTGIAATLLGSTALCTGVLGLLIAVGKVPPIAGGQSWIAHPLPMHLAAAAFALAAAGGVGAWLSRRAGFWGFWTAATLSGAAGAVGLAIALPGASFALLLAAAAAALGGLPCAAWTVSARSPPAAAVEAAAILPALVLFAAVFPLVRFLYTAVGSLAWPLSTLLLGLGAATLLPLLAAAGAQGRRVVIGAAALTAAAGALLTLALPSYSAEWPERVNLEYWLDADTGEAHYLAECDAVRPPAFLGTLARFDPVSRPRFPGSGLKGFFAPAPVLTLAAPELSSLPQPSAQGAVASVQRAADVATSTHFDVRLTSARGAPRTVVVFPPNAHVTQVAISLATGTVLAGLQRLRSGATWLEIVELPADGLELSFDAAGTSPLAIQVFDESFGIPGHLPDARPPEVTSSQDGDLTVVHRTVTLHPAAGR
jgi:hypothetical protein